MTDTKTGITGRKSDVLAAAAALFADRGYAAVGVDEIGERAGITGSAIYNHFDGKEALLAAVILNVAQRVAYAASGAIAQRSGDLKQDLRRLVDATTTTTLELGDAAQVYLREMPRLQTQDRRAVRGADERLLRAARDLMFEATPGLDEASFALRSALVSGAVTAVARERALLPRRALHKLVSDASFAVLQAPTRPLTAWAPSPIGDATPWLPPPSRRDEILTVAAELFAERSYHAVSMEDIGAAAGISAAAIYRHFASKADIANEAFTRVGSRLIVGMESALRQASTPDEALEGLVRSLAGVALDAGDLLVVLAQTIMELAPDDATRELRGRRQILDTWSHVIAVARPELREPHARVLARAGIAGITQAALIPGPGGPDLGETVRLALVLLRS